MSSNGGLRRRTAVVLLLFVGCSAEPAERTAPASAEPAMPRLSRGSKGAPGSVHLPSSTLAGAARGAQRGAPGVAVVELFTSEGCSSCPPADRVLATLKSEARARALPVYTLSFHVDYWNYLGWRDRFSRASYSERQHGYSSINVDNSTYTPQVVVNGQAECVGSNASCIGDLIDVALRHPQRTHIELEAARRGQSIVVDYRVSGVTAGLVLNLALLEPLAESQVDRGENAGERLVHVNVVRSFTSRGLSDGTAGHWTFPYDGELVARRVGVVAYAESATQRDVSGATSVELP